MFTFTTRLMLALLVALPACSMGDATTEGLTSADDGGAEGDAEGDPAGLDEETQTEEPASGEGAEEAKEPPDLLAACDLPSPCEFPVELVRDSKTQSYADSDLCALKALASLEPGLIQTVAAFASAESYLDHVVVAPGVLLRQAHGRSDGLGLWQKAVERCALRDAAFFTACTESFDPACLDPDGWVASCEVLDDLTCPQA